MAEAAQKAHAFTDAELAQAWSTYIDNHGADRLLVNTMRVSLPQRTAVENVFEMVVESEIQVELINEALPHLLSDLRAALQNDLISIHVRANNGASSPITWNEREVLASMIERHPSVKKFVDDLGLSLL
jgi:flagellar basal body L-ring protein FlgH